MRTSHVVKPHSPVIRAIGERQSQPFPLLYGSPGEKVQIVSFAGGRKMVQRLIGMGLNVGSEIRVVRKGTPGPCVIAVGDARLAIGAGMALKIMVSPVLTTHSGRNRAKENTN